jgi:hypothetical protein
LPTSKRNRVGETERDRWEGSGETMGAVPGVNRSAQHEQHTNATLQAAQATDACAQTRECAICQGSEGRGAGKTARSIIRVLFINGG